MKIAQKKITALMQTLSLKQAENPSTQPESERLSSKCNQLAEELRLLSVRERIVESFEDLARSKTDLQKAILLEKTKSQVILNSRNI